jgi:hypothetical protein
MLRRRNALGIVATTCTLEKLQVTPDSRCTSELVIAVLKAHESIGLDERTGAIPEH